MPRIPHLTHPLRQIRQALSMTQDTFAKLVGRSTITIQRIENRTLKMSQELADRILEATGANPVELRTGRRAVDLKGQPYTKQSYEDYKGWSKMTQHSLNYYHHHMVGFLELLLICSERAGQEKLPAVVAALQDSFAKIAEDFNLKKNIEGFLIEHGHVQKRIYKVRDLRKFPQYAGLIGFKDNKRFKRDEKISFNIPDGWILEYQLTERPILPKGLKTKLLGKKDYIIHVNRPIPDTPEFKPVKEVLANVLYWQIVKFTPDWTL